MREAGWSPAGVDGTYQYATAALSVFWPEEEFRILVSRWPHVAAHVGATWDEHRRRVERHCAFLEQEGLRVLGAEEDLGRALLNELDEHQRGRAVVSDEAPRDILTGNEVRAQIAAVPTGIGYQDLDEGQRASLRRLSTSTSSKSIFSPIWRPRMSSLRATSWPDRSSRGSGSV